MCYVSPTAFWLTIFIQYKFPFFSPFRALFLSCSAFCPQSSSLVSSMSLNSSDGFIQNSRAIFRRGRASGKCLFVSSQFTCTIVLSAKTRVHCSIESRMTPLQQWLASTVGYSLNRDPQDLEACVKPHKTSDFALGFYIGFSWVSKSRRSLGLGV